MLSNRLRKFWFKCSVQSLSHVRLFAAPWTAARQGFLSFTVSRSLLRSISIELVMLLNHLVLCHPFSSCPQSFPASRYFPVIQLFTSGGQSIEAAASTSVLPMNIQSWFPLGLTGLISLLSRELSRIFFSTIVWKHQFFGMQLSLWSNLWGWLSFKLRNDFGVRSPSVLSYMWLILYISPGLD